MSTFDFFLRLRPAVASSCAHRRDTNEKVLIESGCARVGSFDTAPQMIHRAYQNGAIRSQISRWIIPGAAFPPNHKNTAALVMMECAFVEKAGAVHRGHGACGGPRRLVYMYTAFTPKSSILSFDIVNRI